MAWSAPSEWERWDPNKRIQCPYDEMHLVPAKRYQYHIIKCREQHPEKDYVSCPFNAKHMMLRTDLRHHITRCPDKGEVEPYSYKGNEQDSEGFYFKGDTSVPCYRREELSIPPDDDWDQDDNEITTRQNLCEYYKMQKLNNSTINQPVNNSRIQDTMSLPPGERERFKNNMRNNAAQNQLSTTNSNHNYPYGNSQYSNNIHSNGHHVNHHPGNNLHCNSQPSFSGNGSNRYDNIHHGNGYHSNSFHGNNQYGSTRPEGSHHKPSASYSGYNDVNGQNTSMSGVLNETSSVKPHTFRGAGRARLAEEARRTQFGIAGIGINHYKWHYILGNSAIVFGSKERAAENYHSGFRG